MPKPLAADRSARLDPSGIGAANRLDLTALQQTPGFLVRVLQIQVFQAFFEYFSPMGISPAEHSSLITVRDNPAVTQSELAAVLRIQLPNLVKILIKLEINGLIKRKRSNRDKRAVELTLTSSGEKAAAKASKMADAFNRLILSSLSKREQQEFIEMLNRLVDLNIKKPDVESLGFR